jgi:hypothetical protein
VPNLNDVMGIVIKSTKVVVTKVRSKNLGSFPFTFLKICRLFLIYLDEIIQPSIARNERIRLIENTE